nr:flagellar hook-basal body complex protein FliE [Limnohabitans sp. DM1]
MSSTISPVRGNNASGSARSVGESGVAPSFTHALASVSDLQSQAQNLQKEVQMQNPDVSMEEAMVAMQKAQIGFQATLHVRNRMVQAYSDIMNMQV